MKKSQSIRETHVRAVLDELISLMPKRRTKELPQLVKKYAHASADTISKSELLGYYRKHYRPQDPSILKLLKMKPVRTLSGVTPLTLLTKPFPCPGQCIFCPVDVRMPKSYIATEPGAQRAGQYGFDPYLQVINRLRAYHDIGHPISKVELIVLGGTWSVYPENYQRWFVTQMFKALNDFGAGISKTKTVTSINKDETLPDNMTYNQYIAKKSTSHDGIEPATNWQDLELAQLDNEHSNCRCVGLVLETRPDYLNPKELIKLRRFGATKIQIGIQSLSDQVLKVNQRGHTVAQTKASIRLLRQAGFKIHAHWMPNLYGSNPKKDKQDFAKLFTDPDICPDELKVYPCSLIEKTELVTLYNQGKWQPYTLAELTSVLTFVLKTTPEYCRLTRIIRDIPSGEIVIGNKSTNLRQLVENKLDPSQLHDIRSREIKGNVVDHLTLSLDDVAYNTSVSTEHFLQFITPERRITGFLRLSIPNCENPITELDGKAIIREVHVYGQSLSVGSESTSSSQHQGLGKQLIAEAVKLAKASKITEVAVISAVGTRDYYRKLGFKDGELYQILKCSSFSLD